MYCPYYTLQGAKKESKYEEKKDDYGTKEEKKEEKEYKAEEKIPETYEEKDQVKEIVRENEDKASSQSQLESAVD
jgi:hypothetical protein